MARAATEKLMGLNLGFEYDMANIGAERERAFAEGRRVISDVSGSLGEEGGRQAANTVAAAPDAVDTVEISTQDDGKTRLLEALGSITGSHTARAGVLEAEDRHQRWPYCLRYRQDWTRNGRREQKPPEGDWRVWLLMGGRGSGKTRAGAEWVQALATGKTARPGLRIALVAETLGDAREVMIDGVSGICRIAQSNRPDFEASRRRLVWPNGTMAQIFSSEDPESLRGPQFDYAWCDELGKWKHRQETWDMLQFALRLGDDPRALVTTTPRPVPILKALIADPGTATCRIRTGDNAANLAPGFLSAMAGRYGGTRLGRQELDGEMIEDREDALWSRAGIEALKLRDTGPLGRIVVAVDPPAGMGQGSCCGIIVAGLDRTGRGVVLADCSIEGASPAGWAGAVVRAYRRFDADRIVAEVNQGGDMVSAVLRGIDAKLPVTSVRASRGKWLRAEPVAALYEQGRVVHAGSFPALEDQMCDFGLDGLSSGRSPDRLDALVWALTALMLDGGGEPRVRGI
ncbi:DNA-packaging protein [Rhizobium herbae]|jgi:phage terminase large subunit-like protein